MEKTLQFPIFNINPMFSYHYKAINIHILFCMFFFLLAQQFDVIIIQNDPKCYPGVTMFDYLNVICNDFLF